MGTRAHRVHGFDKDSGRKALALPVENGIMKIGKLHKEVLSLELQVHVYSWTITLILFVLSFILVKADKPKPQKILHMILRLFYIITLLTGIGLVVSYNFWGPTLIKGALGILLMVLMEMILVKSRDGERTGWLSLAFVVDILLVFYFGYAVIG
jgi:hypothetical protein